MTQNNRNTENKFRKYSGKDSFNIPEKYFDELPGKIMSTVNNTENKKTEIRRNIFRYSLAAAAILLIALLVGGIFIFKEEKQQPEDFTFNLNYNDLIDEKSELISMFEEDMIISVLLEETTTENEIIIFDTDFIPVDTKENPTEEDAIIEYLLIENYQNEITL